MKQERFYVLRMMDQCNQQCRICMVSDQITNTKQPMAYLTICREIKQAHTQGYRMIDFFGGEPTTNPSLVRGALFAKKLGMTCCLATNAQAFASETFTQNFFKHNPIDKLRTTLHSHNPKIHDMITQIPKSYERTLQGLRNILTHMNPRDVIVNIVITRYNIHSLETIVQLLKRLGSPEIKFSGLALEGRILKNLSLVPGLDTVKKYLLKAINLCIKLDQTFFIEKLPFCILKDKHHNRFNIEHSTHFTKLSACRYCQYKKRCIGLEKNILMIHNIPAFYKQYIRSHGFIKHEPINKKNHEHYCLY